MSQEPRILAQSTPPKGKVLVTRAHRRLDGECWFTFDEHKP